MVAWASCCCTALSLVAGWSTTLIRCWVALNCATRLAAAAAERGSKDSTTVTTVGVGVVGGQRHRAGGRRCAGRDTVDGAVAVGRWSCCTPRRSRATAATAATESQVRRDMIRQSRSGPRPGELARRRRLTRGDNSSPSSITRSLRPGKPTQRLAAEHAVVHPGGVGRVDAEAGHRARPRAGDAGQPSSTPGRPGPRPPPTRARRRGRPGPGQDAEGGEGPGQLRPRCGPGLGQHVGQDALEPQGGPQLDHRGLGRLGGQTQAAPTGVGDAPDRPLRPTESRGCGAQVRLAVSPRRRDQQADQHRLVGGRVGVGPASGRVRPDATTPKADHDGGATKPNRSGRDRAPTGDAGPARGCWRRHPPRRRPSAGRRARAGRWPARRGRRARRARSRAGGASSPGRPRAGRSAGPGRGRVAGGFDRWGRQRVVTEDLLEGGRGAAPAQAITGGIANPTPSWPGGVTGERGSVRRSVRGSRPWPGSRARRRGGW